MKPYFTLIIGLALLFTTTYVRAEIKGYEIVSQNNKENVTLYGKEIDGLYRGFKIDFKGVIYPKPYWNSTTSLAYAPQIFYLDMNKDKKKELIITLTTGNGSGVKLEEVHLFKMQDDQLVELIVDHPLAIINNNVKTELSNKEAKICIGDKDDEVDITPFQIKPENLFNDIGFGSIIDYEIIDNQLMVRVSGQISPASFVGDIVISYEYRDNMYQAETIFFIKDINKNPFYGPVTVGDPKGMVLLKKGAEK
ncbi:hypothetical protein [Metabacillus litoralis]|uniref:hypothetical protein n=1 Tax=Metabacillus litoralis TaxID=152268 RepID=UPI001CFE3D49|nr:hypothetical protein [Metabacillus litoralis]